MVPMCVDRKGCTGVPWVRVLLSAGRRTVTARRHSPRGVFWGATAAGAFRLAIVVAGVVSGLRGFDRPDGR
jgi:hypothetical protein